MKDEVGSLIEETKKLAEGTAEFWLKKLVSNYLWTLNF